MKSVYSSRLILTQLEDRTNPSGFTVAGPTGFVNVSSGDAIWGDYDGDGSLDALVVGQSGSTNASRVALIYKGNGTSTFTLAATLPVGVENGAGAWGDIDNDGDLDLAIVGNDSNGGLTTAVFRNDGNNTFTNINAAALVGASFASLAWGDYNNDGRIDLIVAGLESDGGRATRLYRNDGGGVFTEVTGTGLIGVSYSAIAWGDFNGDGYLDLALSGDSADGVATTRVYRNEGGTGVFTEVATLAGAREGSVAWGDYDNDGDLDLLTSGYTTGTTGATTKLYRNDAGEFTAISVTNLIGVGRGAAIWGDYNNDGILDVTVIGAAGNNDASKTVRFFRGVGNGTFTQTQSFVGLTSASAAWGDYDNDGKIDLLATGKDGSNATALLRNASTTVAANTPPTAPTGLTATIDSLTSVTLSWVAPIDTQQPTAGLSYAIRVGTTPGGGDIVHAMANSSTGFRQLQRIGFVQSADGWTLTGLAAGTYFWSVQAIDGGLAGSAFATETSFTIGSSNQPPTEAVLSKASVAENAAPGVVVGTLSATDPDGDPVTFALASGIGDDDNGKFEIDGTILKVKAGATFDFETRPQLSIRVASTDGVLTTYTVLAITVTDVSELTGFIVQNGQTQRSFVRRVDITFTTQAEATAMLASGRVRLTQFNLDGSGTGTNVGLGAVSAAGGMLTLDFGIHGIGGNRNTNAGDGYYVLELDLDGDGSFETQKRFYRLLGDVNGDRTVNAADIAMIFGGYGQPYNADLDVNGDGVVNALDRTLAVRASGRTLAAGLLLDD